MFCKVYHVHLSGGRLKFMVGPKQTAMSVSHRDGPPKLFSPIRGAPSVISDSILATKVAHMIDIILGI